MNHDSFAQMSDRDLLDKLSSVTANSRAVTVELLALLGEIDSRRLYLPEGCSSLFTYCTQVLHFSEDEAYHRIGAARAAKRFPTLLDRLRDGALTLTAVSIIGPHLTTTNADAIINAAMHKSKRDVERQMASLAPKPDAKSIVRRLPDAHELSPAAGSLAIPEIGAPAEVTSSAVSFPPTPSSLASSPHSLTRPLPRDRYLLRVTLTANAHALPQRAQ